MDVRFEVLMEVKIEVEDFWVVTPCSVVVGYQCFIGPCFLHPSEDGRTITTQKFSTQNIIICFY